jgi:tetratricopeptide (TPR) repeat protein
MESIEILWKQATTYQGTGHPDAAAECCVRLLAAQPNHSGALYLLGCIALASGDPVNARPYLQKAIALQPGWAEAREALGAAYSSVGAHQLALEEYRIATTRKPSSHGFFRLATTLHTLGQMEEALAAYRKALSLRYSMAEAHNGMGTALATLGRADEALESFRSAVRFEPKFPAALCNLASALQARGARDEAIDCCRRAVECAPEFAGAHAILGALLAQGGDDAEALTALERAYELAPSEETGHNLSLTLTKLGHDRLERDLPQESISFFERAAQVDPSNDEAQFRLATTLLLLGDYARGFAAHDAWMEISKFKHRELTRPVWNGEPIPGKSLLVYADHGLGDAIQMLRFLPPAAERSGATIVFEGQRALMPLVATIPCVQSVVESPPDFTAPTVEHDAVIGAMTLCTLFCPSLDSIPPAPYVAAPPDRAAAWRDRLASYTGFRVGICWSGDPTNQWNPHRSVGLASLAAAVARPGVDLFSLQVGPGSEQMKELPAGIAISDLGADFGDFVETAAALANLDLVITVETSMAHIAGALGRPCWTMLSARGPWMWLERREDSPWYASMRLFRQTVQDDWTDVLSRISAELAALIASR